MPVLLVRPLPHPELPESLESDLRRVGMPGAEVADPEPTDHVRSDLRHSDSVVAVVVTDGEDLGHADDGEMSVQGKARREDGPSDWGQRG